MSHADGPQGVSTETLAKPSLRLDISLAPCTVVWGGKRRGGDNDKLESVNEYLSPCFCCMTQLPRIFDLVILWC